MASTDYGLINRLINEAAAKRVSNKSTAASPEINTPVVKKPAGINKVKKAPPAAVENPAQAEIAAEQAAEQQAELAALGIVPPESVTTQFPDGSTKQVTGSATFNFKPIRGQLINENAKAATRQAANMINLGKAAGANQFKFSSEELQKLKDFNEAKRTELAKKIDQFTMPETYAAEVLHDLKTYPSQGYTQMQAGQADLLKQIEGVRSRKPDSVDLKALAAGVDAIFGYDMAKSMPDVWGPRQKLRELAGLIDKYHGNAAQMAQAYEIPTAHNKRLPVMGYIQATTGNTQSTINDKTAQSGASAATPPPLKPKLGAQDKPLKQLPAALLQKLSTGYTSALQDLQDIEDLIDQNPKAFGPIAGRVGSLNPYNTVAQKIQSKVESFLQNVGKTKEEGVLKKEDEIKYRKILTNMTQLPEVAKNSVAVTRKEIITDMDNTLLGFSGQYNTDSLKNVYDKARSTAPAKKEAPPENRKVTPQDVEAAMLRARSKR